MKHCTLILLCVNALILVGCGIKPAYVEPPAGAKHEEFPKTYPDPYTNTVPPGLERK